MRATNILSLLALSPGRPNPLVPYVPLDGISSCNSFEISIAAPRMRQAGAIITSSESLAFELMRDAGLPGFKEFRMLVKEEKERTKTAGDILVLGRTEVQSDTEEGKRATGADQKSNMN